MEQVAGTALYPIHRCKTIHLVRHAQGIHNVEGEKNHSAYRSEAFFDAHLTPLGWTQVDKLREHVTTNGISRNIDMVIVSPLLRTMQTAVGVFGGESYNDDDINDKPLMVANAGNSGRPAISSINRPTFVAVEGCRERLGLNPCDRRRSIKEYRELFPAIDFSLIESDEDVLWNRDTRENDDEVAARGMKFFDWLWTRKEKNIAIVCHSAFLLQTLKKFGHDCHPVIRDEICADFKNCEMRTMVLVDRSMLGSESPTTNYKGKILHLPNHKADDNKGQES